LPDPPRQRDAEEDGDGNASDHDEERHVAEAQDRVDADPQAKKGTPEPEDVPRCEGEARLRPRVVRQEIQRQTDQDRHQHGRRAVVVRQELRGHGGEHGDRHAGQNRPARRERVSLQDPKPHGSPSPASRQRRPSVGHGWTASRHG
jgi:hypothetical protein